MNISMDVFVPDTLYDVDDLDRVINNFLDESAMAAKADFNVTQQTFKKKHTFRIRKGKYYREVYTDSLIYSFLNLGTKKHDITPRKAKRLRFQWAGPGSYKPKTKVRKIMSQQGGPSGPIVSAEKVTHPGTEGRFFDEEIADKWDKEQPDQLQRALDSEVD